MDHPLDGCREKIKRANEHIREIHNDIVDKRRMPLGKQTIVATRHLEIGDPKDPSTWKKEEIIFRIGSTPPPLPLCFTLYAGEAIHQLRSALDHLVYQLIVAHTKNPPVFRSAFPVVGKLSYFKSGKKRTAVEEYEAQTGRLKQDISISAEALIRGLQPFQRGASFEDDPLWQLSELDNAYKHRLLMLTVHGVSLYNVTVTGSGGKRAQASFQPTIRFKNGAEIGRLDVTDPAFRHPDVSVDGDLVVNIAFEEVIGRPVVPVIPLLTQLSGYVGRILDSFMNEF